MRHETRTAAGLLGRAAPAGRRRSSSRRRRRAGFDAIFTAEAWGSDAFTPLAWWGRETSRVRLGTSIVQMSGRTPTSIAMHALTLDHLSGGRVVLGMGVSGPQVVEGWYGEPFAKPLARTREVVDIIRQVLAREAPVTNDGPHHPLPYDGPGVGRPGQAAQADRAPAARRPADLARRRGAEERRADRGDRRRLDPDLLHPEVGGDVPAVARRGLRPPGRPAYACGLRDRGDLPPPGGHLRRREGGRARRDEAVRRALHGRHGCEGGELPQAGLRADGLRRPGRRGAASSTSPGRRTGPPR